MKVVLVSGAAMVQTRKDASMFAAEDVGLLGEVCSPTDDVVLAGENILDVEGLFLRLA